MQRETQHDFGLTTQPTQGDAVITSTQPVAVPATTGGTKHDGGKPPMALLDMESLQAEAAVFGFGATKYAPWNWRKGIPVSRLMSAALRHMTAFINGETLDPESGLPHLAHARCNMAMALWMVKHRPDMDDRYKDPNLIDVGTVLGKSTHLSHQSAQLTKE